MIKAGILSMQRIYNYGSFLQAYGLMKILEDLGCDVQFVDYHRGKCLVSVNDGKGIIRKISKVVEVLKYRAPFRQKIRFIMHKRNFGIKNYPYLGITDHMNYIPELDVLVIGSDEVFNCVQNNTKVGFSEELFGVGNRAKILISYAASFGNTTMDKLKKYEIQGKIAEWLNKFDALSVRDLNSEKIVKKLTGREPEYHLDPVLIYDFIGRCKKIPAEVPESNYILVYGYSGRFDKEECRTIRSYADSHKLKVFCIGGVQECCDKFIDCSPFEVIAYFQHADYVVTDTFHGTILSIITHRHFVSFVREGRYGNAEKVIDLLEQFFLKERIIWDNVQLTDILNKPIDYEKTDHMIRTGREKAEKYLERQIYQAG